MSDRIEWVDADAAQIDWTTTPGEWSDAHGSMNDGTAIAFGSIIVEGPLEELTDFAVRILAAVDEMKDDMEEGT